MLPKKKIIPYKSPFLVETLSRKQLIEKAEKINRLQHPLRRLLFDATYAHEEKIIKYKFHRLLKQILKPDIIVKLNLRKLWKDRAIIEIPPTHQHSLLFTTFQDLNDALSRHSNSPTIDLTQTKILSPGAEQFLIGSPDRSTLRQAFEAEFSYFIKLSSIAAHNQSPVINYGSYSYDPFNKRLTHIAPEFWHRLGLRVANGKIHQDPDFKLSWFEIDQKLYKTVIGIAGMSVGGNVLYGWLRDSGYAKAWKAADADHVEIKNLNRLIGILLEMTVSSRSDQTNQLDPLGTFRNLNKAQLSAWIHQSINPYQTPYIYSERLNAKTNLDTFLLGSDKTEEPPLDIFVQEVDDLRFKFNSHKRCRELGIPVLQVSDFGNYTIYQFWNYKDDPHLPIGYSNDIRVEKAMEQVISSGKRADLAEFIEEFCGSDFFQDRGFMDWFKGTGEQPISSLPQLGTTALAAGIGGKFIASYILGHDLPHLIAVNHLNHTVKIVKFPPGRSI